MALAVQKVVAKVPALVDATTLTPSWKGPHEVTGLSPAKVTHMVHGGGVPLRDALRNGLVTTKVLMWFYIGECIGKGGIIGYDV